MLRGVWASVQNNNSLFAKNDAIPSVRKIRNIEDGKCSHVMLLQPLDVGKPGSPWR